jgi:murein DD-endopeptidase MepM/ murein hydrolase activator NlpD
MNVRDQVDKKTGKVTLHGRHHAGWDLYAKPNTEAFAITDGTVVAASDMQGYGHIVLLEFEFQEQAGAPFRNSRAETPAH